MATSRRRWSERLLLVANLTIANTVAALWIVSFVQPSLLGVDFGVAAQALGNDRLLVLPLGTGAAWVAFAASIALLLWNFSWLVRRRPSGVRSNWIVSETAAGPVRIAREAIESALQKTGEALPGVTRVRVAVLLPAPRRVAVTGQFHCAEAQDHLQTSQRLRQALLQRFAELVRLGEGMRAEFELEFQGFLGKPVREASAPEQPADAEPFRGPQYPIEDDDT